ncbi:MAG: hypothetical protein OER22_02150 [Gammaproteobacteria bacterium]|nr:hypothetical protein [Gammaproteobacteria bacterium]MDH3373050.1 hypothetical protein [Gammaproteobacteria bacterium]MDH3408929.1 hypothetical protein [Gammaproteobacteria bacterium]MDH3551396.1 hypothetical protein [Gammaproteobacteria bacterium]
MARGGWTKKMFIIGAVLDGLVAVVMLVPGLEALAWGFGEPVLDAGYRFAMTFGAALMVGWTALLVWAAASPVDRRAVAPLTMLVVAGLMSAEFLGMASGFLPAIRVWTLLIFQMALLAGLALAFRAASDR